MSEKDAYLEKMKAQTDEFDAEIDRLLAKARKAKADVKIDYENQIDELREKRKEIARKMDALESASDDAWKDLKQGLENSWEILKKSLSQAKEKFERGYEEGKREEPSTKGVSDE